MKEPVRAERVLHLNLKAEYFDAIAAGSKREEFRLATPYWRKRLQGREYDQVILKRGYPARDDTARQLRRKWAGVQLKEITHPHFGPGAVTVFAIAVDQGTE